MMRANGGDCDEVICTG